MGRPEGDQPLVIEQNFHENERLVVQETPPNHSIRAEAKSHMAAELQSKADSAFMEIMNVNGQHKDIQFVPIIMMWCPNLVNGRNCDCGYSSFASVPNVK